MDQSQFDSSATSIVQYDPAMPSAAAVQQQPDCRYCHETTHFINYCPKIRCKTCNEFGHTARVCTVNWCGRCNSPGHLASECIAEQCGFCLVFGHGLNRCPQLRCDTCEGIGHLAANCLVSPSLWWCRFCKASGEHIQHILPNCPKLRGRGRDRNGPRGRGTDAGRDRNGPRGASRDGPRDTGPRNDLEFQSKCTDPGHGGACTRSDCGRR